MQFLIRDSHEFLDAYYDSEIIKRKTNKALTFNLVMQFY
jgi:hypothetical protein